MEWAVGRERVSWGDETLQLHLLVWEPRRLLDQGSLDGWVQVPLSSQEDKV